MYIVLRNGQKFGPYNLDNLKHYVESGNILLADTIENIGGDTYTVREILNKHAVKVSPKQNGNVFSQIGTIGKELLIPSVEFIKRDIINDRRLIYLSIFGLAPAFLIRFTFSSWLTFYAIALYFSTIWAIFFFYIFKTNQVKTRQTIVLFFLTQFTAFVLVNIQSLPVFNQLYAFTESKNIVLRLIGFVFGVGLLEETIKALPLLYILYKSRQPLIPQTMVYYGLMSGIGFGVLEGVLYQTTTNTTLGYNDAFFMNIARLTSLPFLHAIWAGIAGYFLSFAFLYPQYRNGLYVLAIFIPALLHGFYDTFGWGILGLLSTVVSVLLLMYYLKRSSDYQNKLLTI